jgi:hypothetical protein
MDASRLGHVQSCLLSSAWVRLRTNVARWFAGGWIIFTGLDFEDDAVLMEGKGRSGRETGKEDERIGWGGLPNGEGAVDASGEDIRGRGREDIVSAGAVAVTVAI